MSKIRFEPTNTMSIPIEEVGFAAQLFDLPLEKTRRERKARFNKICTLLKAADLIHDRKNILHVTRGLNARGEVMIVITSITRSRKAKK